MSALADTMRSFADAEPPTAIERENAAMMLAARATMQGSTDRARAWAGEAAAARDDQLTYSERTVRSDVQLEHVKALNAHAAAECTGPEPGTWCSGCGRSGAGAGVS